MSWTACYNNEYITHYRNKSDSEWFSQKSKVTWEITELNKKKKLKVNCFLNKPMSSNQKTAWEEFKNIDILNNSDWCKKLKASIIWTSKATHSDDFNDSEEWKEKFSKSSEEWKVTDSSKHSFSDIFSVSNLIDNEEKSQKSEKKERRHQIWNLTTQINYDQAFSQVLNAVTELKGSAFYKRKLVEIEETIHLIIQNTCEINKVRTDIFTLSWNHLKDVVKETPLKESAFTMKKDYVISQSAHILWELHQEVWAIHKKYMQQNSSKFLSKHIDLSQFNYVSLNLQFVSFSSKN